MTSPCETIAVDCPACGQRYEDWYRASVNADLDPSLAADDEYMRECSTATCPQCSHVVDLAVLVVEGDVWRVK